MTVLIRYATSADRGIIESNINAICDEGIYLVTSRFIMPERWRRILEANGELNRDLIIVAEVENRVVGHGRMFTSEGTNAHVADLGMAIISEFRDQGIGSQMISFMLDWAKQKGLRKVTLGVFATNERAIHVYEQFGFISEGLLEKQHCIGEEYVDEILMAKFL